MSPRFSRETSLRIRSSALRAREKESRRERKTETKKASSAKTKGSTNRVAYLLRLLSL
jgi:hypothetical protein